MTMIVSVSLHILQTSVKCLNICLIPQVYKLDAFTGGSFEACLIGVNCTLNMHMCRVLEYLCAFNPLPCLPALAQPAQPVPAQQEIQTSIVCNYTICICLLVINSNY